MTRRPPRVTDPMTGLDPLIQLWLLRILVPLSGYREFVESYGFRNDTLAAKIGLGAWIEVDPGEFAQRSVTSELRKRHRQAERKWAQRRPSACLRKNVKRLSQVLGLNRIERRILEFTILIHNERMLDDTADCLGPLSTAKIPYVLSVILNLPEAEIRTALSPQGILARAGLVTVERGSSSLLRSKLELLSDTFADVMVSEEADPVDLLRGTVSMADPAQLTLSDYTHIGEFLAIVRPHLCRALAARRPGVNIFIHGAPGTGKSQLARALAADLGCELFEVVSEDNDGDPVDGEARLRAFRAAQNFLKERRALVVFDEAEDVFGGDSENIFFENKSVADSHKAWMNRMLEENPVATLWLSNSVEGLDPAFCRRFDILFTLPVPPRKERMRILTEACGDLLPEAGIAHIAEIEHLAPAVVAKAASVIRTIREDLDPGTLQSAFERLVSNSLKAQGHPPLIPNDPNRLPEVYDPTFIHADQDLGAVAEGMLKTRTGRICLYGPPGTGKTAFARWLAEHLGVPLEVKRASDLLSAYIGESEQAVAHVFETAAEQGALLLIDEVDSFLQDRRGAQRSWEVSLVNEMLTQMESFPGVFIASTNLMTALDQAAWRRFDLKVKFDFLRPDQAWSLFTRYCNVLGFETLPELEPRVKRMDRLTPGDFAMVRRRHRFHPLESAVGLVASLEAECTLKEGARTRIGFV